MRRHIIIFECYDVILVLSFLNSYRKTTTGTVIEVIKVTVMRIVYKSIGILHSGLIKLVGIANGFILELLRCICRKN